MARRVLLLEEDATYAESLVRGLGAAGCEVTLVRSGDAGEQRATSERFDVLVVSAELPGVNGFRLCAKLKKRAGFATPIVLMGSERTVGFDEHQKLPSRADGYLRKPVVIAELLAMLEQLPQDRAAPGRPSRAVPPPRPSSRAPSRPSRPPRPPRASALKPPPLPRPSTLARALDDAETQATALGDLRKQLAEQVALVARLQAEQAKKPPPLPGTRAATEAAQRQQARKREEELLETRSALAAERHAAIDLRNAVVERDAKIATLELELREQAARAKRSEELTGAAQSAREEASRRSADATKQLEPLRAEVNKLRVENAKSAKVAADAEVALRRELEQALARAQDLDGRLARALAERQEAEAASAAELERVRTEAARALGERQQREAHVIELERAFEAAKAALATEQATRASAEAAARTAEQRSDSERRARAEEEAALTRRLAESTRATEDARKARAELETAHAKRLTELRAHHESERNKLLEELRGLRLVEQQLRAEVALHQDKGAEDLARAEERYVRHMSDVVARERMQAVSAADAERAREEVKSLTEKLSHAHKRVEELEQALESLFEAQTATRHSNEAVDSARARMGSELSLLEQKQSSNDEARRALQAQVAEQARAIEALVAGRERAERAEAAIAEQLAAAEAAARARAERQDAALRQVRAAHNAEVDLLRDAHGRAIGARDRAMAEALNRVAREVEERVTSKLAAEHAGRLAEAVQHARDEEQVEHAAELAHAHQVADDAITAARTSAAARVDALAAQLAELSAELTKGREALDVERRERLSAQEEHASSIAALEEALVAARAEVAAKSSEVELLRRTLEHEGTAARAAIEELERERTLIAQAKTVLSELVARIDPPGDEETPSRRSRRR